MKYFLSCNDHVTGPYTREELLDSLNYGVVAQQARVCQEGTEDWLPIGALHSPAPLAVAATPFTELRQAQAAGEYGQQPVAVYHHYQPLKSPGIAILLEILPGIFLQTFGIGNLYSGNIVTGLVLMFTYWASLIVNFILVFFLIGLATLPITFMIYLVFAIITAKRSAERANWQMMHSRQS